MTHSTINSVLSNTVELQLLALGLCYGLLLVVLWDPYREVAMFLLGFALAMAVGQTLTPWAPSYSAIVEQRPLAAKPWYFLVPLTAVLNIGVPALRIARKRFSLPQLGQRLPHHDTDP